jgi:indole-3-glycerol phosphate synthase
LKPSQLIELAHVARELAMEPLVEVRDLRELDTALEADAMFIGVNSRNLETLVVDAAIFKAVLPRIPADRIAIAESGIGTAADVRAVADSGADAVLVGSALSLSGDPADALRMMTGVERRGRG